MATCYMKRIITTCLTMIEHFCDTIIAASLVKQWQLSSFKVQLLEKCWKLKQYIVIQAYKCTAFRIQFLAKLDLH